MEFKICCHCKIERPITQFYKNRTTRDGYQPECSQCRYIAYLLNKEKLFPKITCSCGRTIYKYYLEKHLKTDYHNRHLIQNLKEF